jgi:nitrogen fixation/metabolism regulation signal transduction histidine kinase
MVVARSIVKPISNLAETANNISKGHMDMEFKVDSNDELKVLSDAFERMKTSLNKAMQMLKK